MRHVKTRFEQGDTVALVSGDGETVYLDQIGEVQGYDESGFHVLILFEDGNTPMAYTPDCLIRISGKHAL